MEISKKVVAVGDDGQVLEVELMQEGVEVKVSNEEGDSTYFTFQPEEFEEFITAISHMFELSGEEDDLDVEFDPFDDDDDSDDDEGF